MNKSGNVFHLFFFVVAFVLVWGMFLAKWFTIVGEFAVTTYGATGLWAFFVTNLNLWIFIGLILMIFTYGVFSQQ